FRGRGIEFEEVRQYAPGDDVRSIDWKVTARRNIPFVKRFREERERTVMIGVEVSASTQTGTQVQLKETLLAKTGAVLTLIAEQNNDRVGLLTYGTDVQTYHPPRKGRGVVWRILREVLGSERKTSETRPQSPGDLAGMFEFLHRTLRKHSIVFVLSDFHDLGFERAMGSLARRHEVTCVRVTDPADHELPHVGLLRMADPETGQVSLIDTNDPFTRKHYQTEAERHWKQFGDICGRHGIDILTLRTDGPFMPELSKFFGRRNLRPRLKRAAAGGR
ncbi:MAG: DUF58 domain-containing protein, partial [Bdellovibrionales bacterium]|nr:DUF58 domain-containing protein [Bdellovibrionales bacterium]